MCVYSALEVGLVQLEMDRKCKVCSGDTLDILDDDELDLIFGDIDEDDFSSLDMEEEEKSKLMDLIENIKNDE